MPELISAGLFERDGTALVAHRRRGPFAGQWMLPVTVVDEDETAEGAVSRHALAQFGVNVGEESFVETVYVEDPDDQRKYVANIFRADLGDGPMRFRADGDYDDARWLAPADLADVWMPPSLRDALVRILTDPSAPPAVDWTVEGDDASAQGLPLGDRIDTAPPVPPPDNAAGWNVIAAAYQAEYYGDRDAGRLKWSRGVFEDELQLLGDVRGKRALVLGSGGGQDVLALTRLGAVAVGIDISREQIAYARKYVDRHGAENASFVEGSADDLTRFDDASFDVVVSIHALAYVQDLERAFSEAARVLKPSGVLVISVPHPLNQVLGDDAPYAVARSYWADTIDWEWKLEAASARFRERTPTIAQWFGMMTNAGFVVEQVIEPYQGDVQGDDTHGFDMRRARLAPYVIILRARKR